MLMEHNYRKLAEKSASLKTALPFPHVEINNFLDKKQCQSIKTVLPDEKWDYWKSNSHSFETRKLFCENRSVWPEILAELGNDLTSATVCQILKNITNSDFIYSDPYFSGAGLHAMKKGGRLAPHSDAEFHALTKMRRTYTLIIFLSDSNNNGGELILFGDKGEKKVITPKMGKCVIFENKNTYIHGVRDWGANDLRYTMTSFFYMKSDMIAPISTTPGWSFNRNIIEGDGVMAFIGKQAFILSELIGRMHYKVKLFAYNVSSKANVKIKNKL